MVLGLCFGRRNKTVELPQPVVVEVPSPSYPHAVLVFNQDSGEVCSDASGIIKGVVVHTSTGVPGGAAIHASLLRELASENCFFRAALVAYRDEAQAAQSPEEEGSGSLVINLLIPPRSWPPNFSRSINLRSMRISKVVPQKVASELNSLALLVEHIPKGVTSVSRQPTASPNLRQQQQQQEQQQEQSLYPGSRLLNEAPKSCGSDDKHPQGWQIRWQGRHEQAMAELGHVQRSERQQRVQQQQQEREQRFHHARSQLLADASPTLATLFNQEGFVYLQNRSSLTYYGALGQKGGLWSEAGSGCSGNLSTAHASGQLQGPILELFALDAKALAEFLKHVEDMEAWKCIIRVKPTFPLEHSPLRSASKPSSPVPLKQLPTPTDIPQTPEPTTTATPQPLATSWSPVAKGTISNVWNFQSTERPPEKRQVRASKSCIWQTAASGKQPSNRLQSQLDKKGQNLSFTRASLGRANCQPACENGGLLSCSLSQLQQHQAWPGFQLPVAERRVKHTASTAPQLQQVEALQQALPAGSSETQHQRQQEHLTRDIHAEPSKAEQVSFQSPVAPEVPGTTSKIHNLQSTERPPRLPVRASKSCNWQTATSGTQPSDRLQSQLYRKDQAVSFGAASLGHSDSQPASENGGFLSCTLSQLQQHQAWLGFQLPVAERLVKHTASAAPQLQQVEASQQAPPAGSSENPQQEKSAQDVCIEWGYSSRYLLDAPDPCTQVQGQSLSSLQGCLSTLTEAGKGQDNSGCTQDKQGEVKALQGASSSLSRNHGQSSLLPQLSHEEQARMKGREQSSGELSRKGRDFRQLAGIAGSRRFSRPSILGLAKSRGLMVLDKMEGPEELILAEHNEEGEECFHEVEMQPVTDPITDEPAFILLQRDVTEQVEREQLLTELTEGHLAMLSQIFPRHVIDALSSDGAITLANISDMAFNHEGVTILFLDLVGFTSMSKNVPAEEVLVFLNVLFSRFDKLVSKYQVQKIDVIGYAYLVSSGICTADQDGYWAVDEAHNPVVGACKAMGLAMEMQRAVLDVRMPDGAPVQVRIGIHTGPCVSGIVGLGMPKWSCLGDTVNTASRMEATTGPQTIQISSATRNLLPSDIPIELAATGGVAIKGKGIMDTWVWQQPPSWQAKTDRPPALPESCILLHQRVCPATSARTSATPVPGSILLPKVFQVHAKRMTKSQSQDFNGKRFATLMSCGDGSEQGRGSAQSTSQLKKVATPPLLSKVSSDLKSPIQQSHMALLEAELKSWGLGFDGRQD